MLYDTLAGRIKRALEARTGNAVARALDDKRYIYWDVDNRGNTATAVATTRVLDMPTRLAVDLAIHAQSKLSCKEQ